MYIPQLGARLPARGNPFSKWLGRCAFRGLRWHFEGTFPDVKQAVLIVVPHTSNLDFFVGVAAMFALGLRVSWLGKHTIFRPPLQALMHWLGGIPVNRHNPRGLVAQTVDAFKRHERLVLALAPEGTRQKVDHWKKGFYHIACEAHVSILPVAFDYAKRAIVVGALFKPSGDWQADSDALRHFYKPVMGRYRQRATLEP